MIGIVRDKIIMHWIDKNNNFFIVKMSLSRFLHGVFLWLSKDSVQEPAKWNFDDEEVFLLMLTWRLWFQTLHYDNILPQIVVCDSWKRLSVVILMSERLWFQIYEYVYVYVYTD